MEIEAKFRVHNQQVFATLLALDALGPFALQRGAVEQQHNTYYDTADLRLRSVRYGLRVRDLRTHRVATLKGGGTVNGALHQREEWEEPIGADNRPEHWPQGELRERTLALLDGAPLEEVVTVHTLRYLIDVLRDGQRVAELSLDEGTIGSGKLAEPFCELEVELKGGSMDDLDTLIAALTGRFRLQPEERSKLARGMALYDQGRTNG